MKQFLIGMSAAAVLITGAAGVARAEQGVRLPALDASDPASVESFRAAVGQAAKTLCPTQPVTGTRLKRDVQCREEIWEEVMEKISPEQKLALSAKPQVVVAKVGSPLAASVR